MVTCQISQPYGLMSTPFYVWVKPGFNMKTVCLTPWKKPTSEPHQATEFKPIFDCKVHHVSNAV